MGILGQKANLVTTLHLKSGLSEILGKWQDCGQNRR